MIDYGLKTQVKAHVLSITEASSLVNLPKLSADSESGRDKSRKSQVVDESPIFASNEFRRGDVLIYVLTCYWLEVNVGIISNTNNILLLLEIFVEFGRKEVYYEIRFGAWPVVLNDDVGLSFYYNNVILTCVLVALLRIIGWFILLG